MSVIIKDHVSKYGFTSTEQTDLDSGQSGDSDDNFEDDTEDVDLQQADDSSDIEWNSSEIKKIFEKNSTFF